MSTDRLKPRFRFEKTGCLKSATDDSKGPFDDKKEENVKSNLTLEDHISIKGSNKLNSKKIDTFVPENYKRREISIKRLLFL
jgi:hypothetical protein